jgi:trk system potassium uptake protein TrkA
MKIIILGCGRVGATLAQMMDQAGHKVTVIDYSNDSFHRLDQRFTGKTVIGDGIDEDVLKRAEIEQADVFVAVTNGDNRNIMASQIAKHIFHVRKVLCRIYDPTRTEIYHGLGLDVICPTIVGAQLFKDAIMESIPQQVSGELAPPR